MNKQKKFLGTGWSFPVSVDKMSGYVATSSAEEKIAQSIRMILGTQRGERIMRPDFGCNLRTYTFSEMNYSTFSEIEQDVRRALILWEPRITDVEIKCRPASDREGVLLIEIAYVVRSTNNPYNMVYPFYLTENT